MRCSVISPSKKTFHSRFVVTCEKEHYRTHLDGSSGGRCSSGGEDACGLLMLAKRDSAIAALYRRARSSCARFILTSGLGHAAIIWRSFSRGVVLQDS